MENEAKLLKAALLNKERIQEFLANLDRRMVDGSLPQQRYELLKSDYQQRMTAAVSEISSIKSGLKLRLQEIKNRVNVLSTELEELRARHDVGQMSLGTYQRAERNLIRKVATIKRDIPRLEMLVDAKSSAHLVVTRGGFPRWALVSSVCAAAVIVLCAGGFVAWRQQWIQPPWISKPAVPPPATTDNVTPKPPVTDNVTPSTDWTSITAAVQPSIVSVQSDNGSSCGIFINRGALVLTPNMIARSGEPVTLTLPSKVQCKGKVVGWDEKLGLALINISDNVTLPQGVLLGDSDVIKVGEEVVAIGCPFGAQGSAKSVNGRISEITDDNGVKHIRVGIPFDADKVGGALINNKGEVIGIVIGYSEKDGSNVFAIAINNAKDLINTAMQTK